jgi:hypothetical protein
LAYKKFGFTQKALRDIDSDIRLKAYKSLGFTEEALKDENYYIRNLAQEYFENRKNNEQ